MAKLRVKKTVFITVFILIIIAHIIIYYVSDDSNEDFNFYRGGHQLDMKIGKYKPQTPTTTTVSLQKIDESRSDTRVFKSYTDAQLFMKSVKDLKNSPQIVIQYSNFSRRIPNFIEKRDYETFMRSDRNIGNLVPPSYELLRGVVEVVPNATFKMDYECGFRSNSDYLKIPRHRTPSHSYDVLVPLVIPMGFLFQHFFDGTLPKIIQALAYIQRPEVKILIEQPYHRNVYRILEKLNIDRSKIVWHLRSDSTTVYHANYMIFTCAAPPLHPVLWKQMRTILGVKDILEIPIANSLVIYLTRAGATNGGRRATNEEDVLKYLDERYSDRLVIFNGKYELDEAISVFGKSSIIIGTHGGAFYNMNYAPLNTTVIEFVPVLSGGRDIASLPHAIFWAMSDLLEQTYWRIPCLSVNYQHDMVIDIHKLKQILDNVSK